ncbi:hypothetical protein NECAME_01409 [Necator americanus]|uniref:Uncharacterized protein n=1 Tax=Necator americanus TaxID=51031 RepID=W2TUL1_NECAM|nr:hypothetical protein NECAME_01409 [Necator americanus]ETN85518.1 hypothetical protein NECAME_01409 [Necator americanus]
MTNTFPRITKSELEQYQLVVSVWHKDLLTQNAPIAEAAISLRDYDWDTTCPVWYQLEGKTQVPTDPCPWRTAIARVHIRLTFSLWDRERRIGPLSLLLRDVRFSEIPPQVLAHRHATLVASA